MARKNLLLGLTERKLPAGNSEIPEPGRSPPLAFAGRGALGAVTRTIDDLAARAETARELRAQITSGDIVVELDPAAVDRAPVIDRMQGDDESFRDLLQAIEANGQASPILVRPHPNSPDRYQVAFGHRRLRAAVALNRPVRAVVKLLSDRELVVAQGQENSARTDLSFIERARFAYSLEHSGYDRDTIMQALNADKSGVSRMISVVSALPLSLIDAIGAAPGIGRDRWLELAGFYASAVRDHPVEPMLTTAGFASATSDERFLMLTEWLSTPTGAENVVDKPGGRIRARGQGRYWLASDGHKIARITTNDNAFVLAIDRRIAPEFGEYLLSQMDCLYEAYRKSLPV